MGEAQGMPITVGEVLIVEHFIERRRIPITTAVGTAIRFGGSQRQALATTEEFSTLDADGRLPQNKVGRLSGVMVDFHQVVGGSEAAKDAAVQACHEYRGKVRCRIYVGNVVVCEHPLAVLTAPGPVYHGITATVGAATSPRWLGNGGWPVSFGEHPLMERQSLAVDVDIMAPITTAPTVDVQFLSVCWQVKTATMFAGRG